MSIYKYNFIALKNKISEEDLVRLLKERNKGAFEYFYDQYSSAVYGIIIRVVKIEELAEETLQDVFLKYWNKIEEYQPSKGRLFTWMLNLARNQAIDKVRSKEFKGIRKTDELDQNVHTYDRTNISQKNTDFIGVKDLLEKLSEDQRQIIELMYFQGYSQSEIAEEYNIPLGTVKTRAKAAMVKLRELF